MGKFLFGIAAAVSLTVCLATAGLWVRSLGHFEQISLSRTSMPSPDEARTSALMLRWYSNTLRLHTMHTSLPAATNGEGVLARDRNTPSYRTGWKCSFAGEHVTRFWESPTPGFGFRHQSESGRWFLTISVRPWLPTLIASILPFAWYFRSRKAKRSWQLSLREMPVMPAVFSILLGIAAWLKH